MILGLRNLSLSTSDGYNLRAEVEAYFLDTHESDSLTFWQVGCVFIPLSLFIHSLQENRSRYPTIFLLALDIILSIQASSVPCERIFSSAKETMTLRRNRISAELMEALQMLKYSYGDGRELNFMEGLSPAEELARLEGLTEEQSCIPEDMTGFMNSLTSR